jgi:hypothetical protein
VEGEVVAVPAPRPWPLRQSAVAAAPHVEVVAVPTPRPWPSRQSTKREREKVVETELLQEEERGLLQELPCLRLERNNIKVSGSGDVRRGARRGGEDVRLGGGGVVVVVEDLERVERTRFAVPDLVHHAGVPATKDLELVEVGEAELAGPG